MFGYDEDVCWGGGIDVAKGEGGGIFVDFGGGPFVGEDVVECCWWAGSCSRIYI